MAIRYQTTRSDESEAVVLSYVLHVHLQNVHRCIGRAWPILLSHAITTFFLQSSIIRLVKYDEPWSFSS